MRSVVAVMVLSLAACSPAAGPAGPAGASVDVSALVAEIARLEARIVDVEARKAVKVPHLVVAETGDDLGPFAGFDRAWSEQLGAYYRLAATVQPTYSQPKCAGEARTQAVPGFSFALNMFGEIQELHSDATMMQPVSFKNHLGDCVDSNGVPAPMVTFASTGIAARAYAVSALRVDMR